MNREIVFRAKDIRTGEWMEGYFGKDYAGVAYITTLDGVSTATVDEATLGQFTGLLDKNGSKVFEGDVLGLPERWYEKDGEIVKGDGSVYFESGMFKVNNISICSFQFRPTFGIIGNIHEEREAHNG